MSPGRKGAKKASKATSDGRTTRTTSQRRIVTILVPTLNEEAGVGPTLDAVDQAAFRRLGFDVEFLIIDGASQDGTAKEAKRRGARVIIDKRKGYGRAYKTGLPAAKGDYIVTGDADGTYPFEKAHEYVARAMKEGHLFVTCDRYARMDKGAMSAKHRLGNFVLSSTTRILFGVGFRDSQSGMWVIHKDAVTRFPLDAMSDGMAFSQEIKVEAYKRFKGRVAEFPSSLAPRIGVPVLASWRDGLRNLGALFTKRLTTRW